MTTRLKLTNKWNRNIKVWFEIAELELSAYGESICNEDYRTPTQLTNVLVNSHFMRVTIKDGMKEAKDAFQISHSEKIILKNYLSMCRKVIISNPN